MGNRPKQSNGRAAIKQGELLSSKRAAKELPSEEISLVPQKIYINMLYTHKNLKETSILFLLRAL